jgi:hypothetical protein
VSAEHKIVNIEQPQAAVLEEEYFSPAEVAKKLRVSSRSVYRWFENWPGVLHLGMARPGTRSHFTMRIPKSSLEAFLGASAVGNGLDVNCRPSGRCGRQKGG